ncbi:serine/threonine protein phosphatase [Luteimonas aquatica]|uniref:serine/threonine protein phosphatase n=1 Tax=Luteimonas aquatica TaxID=450364 RepID=UPI001F5936D4|nr:serine/threonine protein phosphatase [Luteimonas aquatica]
MPVRATVIEGRRVWIKSYPDGGGRRFSLALLDGIARRLGLGALRPPPHRGGGQAKRIEARRLRELQAQGVPVPALLDEDAATLRLGDLGPSLASRLREAGGDPARQDALVRAAIAAIGAAHRRGAYFGQPVPRNIAVADDGRVGFLDFEEDPLEVMTLEQAQARDWVLFTFGIAPYYDERPDTLVALLDGAFRDEPADVGAHAHVVGERLGWLVQPLRRLGRSARALAHSIFAIRIASM